MVHSSRIHENVGCAERCRSRLRGLLHLLALREIVHEHGGA